jgi:hypothetical protein
LANIFSKLFLPSFNKVVFEYYLSLGHALHGERWLMCSGHSSQLSLECGGNGCHGVYTWLTHSKEGRRYFSYEPDLAAITGSFCSVTKQVRK